MPPTLEQQNPPEPIPQAPQNKSRFFLITTMVIIALVIGASVIAWAYQTKIFSLISRNPPVAVATQPCYVVQGDSVFFTNGNDSISPKNSYLVFGADSRTFTPITEKPLSAFGVGSAQVSGSVCYGKDSKHVFFGRYIITGADINSLQILTTNPRFSKDSQGVYRDGMRLFVKIDVPSFVMLDRIYGKDSNAVYYNDIGNPNYERFLPLPKADVASFVSLGDYYAKDANSVYEYGRPIADVDVKTFTALGCYYAKDSNKVYRYGDSIADANPSTFTIPADAPCDSDAARRDTFQQALDTSGQDPYTKTKTRVYYNSDQIISNLENLGIPGPTPESAASLKGVDPVSFTTIKNDPAFGKDATHVYAGAFVIDGADSATFQLLSRFYAKDVKRVYLFWPNVSVVDGADPNTFVVLDNPFGSSNGLYTGSLAKDKNHIYSQGKIIPGDPATFAILNDHYNKDSSHVYMGTTTISSNPSTFWGDPDGYFAKDGNTIYYRGVPIAGANAATFSVQRTYPYFYGIDSTNVYYVGYQSPVILNGADQSSFVVIDDSNDGIKYDAMDKNHFYYDDKVVK